MLPRPTGLTLRSAPAGRLNSLTIEAVYLAGLRGDAATLIRVLKDVRSAYDKHAATLNVAKQALAEATEAAAEAAAAVASGKGGAKKGAAAKADVTDELTPEEMVSKAAAAVCQIEVAAPERWRLMDPTGAQLLGLAAARGACDVLRALINGGADVSACDDGGTALHRAAAKGHVAAINLLLSAGARIDTTARDGGLALHCAARHGHESAARVLLGAPTKEEEAAGDAAQAEAEAAAVEAASAAKPKGGKSAGGAKGGKGKNAAVEEEEAAVAAAELAKRRAAVSQQLRFVTARDASGATPLMLACGAGHLDVAKMLLVSIVERAAHEEGSARIDPVSDEADAPLGAAPKKGAKVKTAPPPPEAESAEPVVSAFEMRRAQIEEWTRMAVTAHAELHDAKGHGSVHYAAVGGHAEIAMWLMKRAGVAVGATAYGRRDMSLLHPHVGRTLQAVDARRSVDEVAHTTNAAVVPARGETRALVNWRRRRAEEQAAAARRVAIPPSPHASPSAGSEDDP